MHPSKEADLNAEGLSMSDEKDDDFGLEFNLPDGVGETSEKEEEKPADSDKGGVQFDPTEESDGLSFKLGDDEEPAASESSAEEPAVGELELGDDTPGDLEIGDSDSAGDLELGDDSSVGDLELGDDSPGDLELGDDSPGDLELGDDSSVGDLELGDDTPEESTEEAAVEFGDLELGDETATVTDAEEVVAAPEEEVPVEETIAEVSPDSASDFNDDDLLNIPGAPTDDDMEISGNEISTKATSESTGDIDISGLDLPEPPYIEDTPVEVTPTMEVEAPEPVVPKQEPVTEPAPTVNAAPPPFPGQNLGAIDQNELLRLQGLIRSLKEEREGYLQEIAENKTEKRILEQENLSQQASIDELRIEVEILKRKRQEEVEEAQYQLRSSEDRAAVFEQKYKSLKKEFEQMNIRYNEEVSKVKRREKELENQLELSQMDTENQVNSRDEVILNLKRKIDVLQFNMENSDIREQQHKREKVELEEKLEKMMKTLRGSIKLLEEDLGLDKDILDEIKKL